MEWGVRVIVVFDEDDQRTIAWSWNRGEAIAMDMSESEIRALASWIEANTERIYNATGREVPSSSRAMKLVARLRGMVE